MRFIWGGLAIGAGLLYVGFHRDVPSPRSLVLGAVLVVTDVVVETLGAYLNLWVTHGSIFTVGGAPIEVLIIAFFAGASIEMVYPNERDEQLLLLLLIATLGSVLEFFLRQIGVLEYLTWWNGVAAFLLYLVVFAGLFALYDIMAPTFRITPQKRHTD